jgi:CheY-like chemotaxis protein
MALRVLLADESTTIRKVIQLALQDFGVEVKAVPSGLDVAEVARLFNPDVVFADVLLQKRNGYEVCAELKRDATLRDIPVILMWNSFMAFDEGLAKTSAANDRLEKPFDVDTLRALILKHVPVAKGNPVASHLEFDPSPSAKLAAEVKAQANNEISARATTSLPEPPRPSRPASPPVPPHQDPPAAAAVPEWNMDSFDNIDDFAKQIEAAIPDPPQSQGTSREGDSSPEPFDAEGEERFESFSLSQSSDDQPEPKLSRLAATAGPESQPAGNVVSPLASGDELRSASMQEPKQQVRTEHRLKPESDVLPVEPEEPWTNHDINEFRLDLRGDDIEVAEPIVPILDEPPSISMDPDDTVVSGLELDDDRTTAGTQAQTQGAPAAQHKSASPATLEAHVREDLEKLVERLVRELLPEIAERVVKRELDRILDDQAGVNL